MLLAKILGGSTKSFLEDTATDEQVAYLARNIWFEEATEGLNLAQKYRDRDTGVKAVLRDLDAAFAPLDATEPTERQPEQTKLQAAIKNGGKNLQHSDMGGPQAAADFVTKMFVSNSPKNEAIDRLKSMYLQEPKKCKCFF